MIILSLPKPRQSLLSVQKDQHAQRVSKEVVFASETPENLLWLQMMLCGSLAFVAIDRRDSVVITCLPGMGVILWQDSFGGNFSPKTLREHRKLRCFITVFTNQVG